MGFSRIIVKQISSRRAAQRLIHQCRKEIDALDVGHSKAIVMTVLVFWLSARWRQVSLPVRQGDAAAASSKEGSRIEHVSR